MEIVQSQKQKDILLNEGYRYRKARINTDGSTSWRCIQENCRGRLRTVNATTKIVTGHFHAPNPPKNDAVKSVAQMRKLAVQCISKPRQIIQESVSAISLEAAIYLPKYSTAQRNIQRIRKRMQQPYPNPRVVADIQIPSSLQNTHRNKNFVLWDSGAADPNRILLFGTEENLNILEQNGHWFVDGTFKVAPALFFQVFTIHALADYCAIPLVYALLQDKKEATYIRVFQKLLELKQNLKPTSIMSDFEKACQNAISLVFPTTKLVGCLFHLGQCLWRKVQELHLTELYRDNESIRLNIKMLISLSFLPVADVPDVFDVLTEHSPDELNNLLDYWEDTYIGRKRRGRRSEPRFAVALWNVRDRVLDGLPRTNNSVEAWHCAFQQTIDCHHPSIYKLIDHFRKEQDYVEIKMERFKVGIRQPEASKAKYVLLNQRLQALVPTYKKMDSQNYLRGIAHNITV